MKSKKIYILQLISSIFVGLSTFIIAVITVVSVSRDKDTEKKIKYKKVKKVCIAIAIAILGVVLINGVLMTGKHLYLNYIATTAFLFGINYYLVNLQIKDTNALSDDSLSQKSKSNKKKTYIILVIILIALWFLFVVGFVTYRVISMRNNVIPDLNGLDDYSLNTLTEDEVVQTNGYTAFLTGESQKGESTNVGKDYEYADYNFVTFNAKSFNGIKVLQATNISTDCCEFEISSEVNSGNFVIVITVDGELYSKVDINQKVLISLEGIKDKTVLVKIAGESSECKIEVERKI